MNKQEKYKELDLLYKNLIKVNEGLQQTEVWLKHVKSQGSSYGELLFPAKSDVEYRKSQKVLLEAKIKLIEAEVGILPEK